MDWLSQYAAAIGAGLLSWLLADTRSKARISFIEERVSASANMAEKNITSLISKVGVNEIALAKLNQESLEVHRSVQRLDEQKASREVVDGFRSEITNLRLDMDKRFDRIERMLTERDDD